MNILGKVLTSTLTALFAVIGGIWTAFTVLNTTMDSKVADAKVTIRIEQEAKIGELRGEIYGVKSLVESMDKKVDILIERRK